MTSLEAAQLLSSSGAHLAATPHQHSLLENLLFPSVQKALVLVVYHREFPVSLMTATVSTSYFGTNSINPRVETEQPERKLENILSIK